MRRALVISGGGSKGAFSVGALENLIHERQLWFDVMSGVSIGALNTLMLSQAQNRPHLGDLLEELKDVWFGFTSNDQVYRHRYRIPLIPSDWKEIANAALTLLFNKDSLYTLKPARDLIYGRVDPNLVRTSPIEAIVGWVSLLTRRYVEVSNHDHAVSFIEAAIASGSIPMTFPVVNGNGIVEGVDGGVREGTPLAGAIRALAKLYPDESEYEVYVLVHSRAPADIPVPGVDAAFAGIDLSGWLRVGDRALGAMQREVHVNDIKHVLEINAALEQGCAAPGMVYVRPYLIYPKDSLGSGLDFGNAEQHLKNFDHGLERARVQAEEPVQ